MKQVKQGYAISTDQKGKFFTSILSAKRYIKKENKGTPPDCQMNEKDIYRTTNEK